MSSTIPRRSHGASAGSIDGHGLPKYGADGAQHYSKSSSWIGQRARQHQLQGDDDDDDGDDDETDRDPSHE
jgi:hypothetical protein